ALPALLAHLGAQRQVDRPPGRLGPAGSLPGQRVRRDRAIAAMTIGVAPQLAGDRRRRATQAPSDAAHRLATRACQRDLLTLRERQVAALQIAPTARTHPAARSHPARPL